jgi:hypothetical protein
MKIGLSHVVILGAGASRAAFPTGDVNGSRLPLMADLVETVGINALLEQNGIEYRGRNFEELYDDLCRNPESKFLAEEINERTYEYFSRLSLPKDLTIYDRLVLSLRGKDAIATFNWDPLLALAYRRNSNMGALPRLISLHGNTAIGVCEKDKIKGINGNRCVTCGNLLQPSTLLYPIKQKKYSDDPFLMSEWSEFGSHLGHAYFLTIYGYSAPSADLEAVELIRKNWGENKYRDIAEIEIIDIRPREESIRSWQRLIVRQHFGTMDHFKYSHLSRHPRRSCEALFQATMQNDPWPNNFTPEEATLEEFQNWIRPLILEEQTAEKDGYSGLPCEQLKKRYY